MAERIKTQQTQELALAHAYDVKGHLLMALGSATKVTAIDPSDENWMAIRKLQEAIMWSGWDIKNKGTRIESEKSKTSADNRTDGNGGAPSE